VDSVVVRFPLLKRIGGGYCKANKYRSFFRLTFG
jgi:hypothetical protein